MDNLLKERTHPHVHKEITKKTENRGRDKAMSTKLANKLPGIVDKLERKHKKRNVVLRMIFEELKERAEDLGEEMASYRTVLRELHRRNLFFTPQLKRLPLKPEYVKERLEFARKYVTKPLTFWRHRVLWQDEGKMDYMSSKAARAEARSMQKTHSYRNRTEGKKKGRCSPCKRKHRNNVQSHKVFAVVGGGKVRLWKWMNKAEYQKYGVTKWCAISYAGFVQDYLKPAYDEYRVEINRAHPIYLMHDQDPKTHTSGKGKVALRASKFNEIIQPRRTPELSILDESIWTLIHRKMVEEEMAWEYYYNDDFSETLQEFKDRAERIAFDLTPDEIYACSDHTRKVCKKLIAAEGSYI